jgi:hypothetical protein
LDLTERVGVLRVVGGGLFPFVLLGDLVVEFVVAWVTPLVPEVSCDSFRRLLGPFGLRLAPGDSSSGLTIALITASALGWASARAVTTAMMKYK